MKSISIHWFRQDLRLSDNPALSDAAENGKILPIYILDDVNSGEHKIGAASRWWLHHSLCELNKSLLGKLVVFSGDPMELLPQLANELSANLVTWNRAYEPWRIKRDTKVKASLEREGITVRSFNGSVLWEPWEVRKNDGTPYRVFTPFYRRGCLSADPPRRPNKITDSLDLYEAKNLKNGYDSIAKLGLLSKNNWINGLENTWKVGETAAKKQLLNFLDNGLNGYKDGRNFPAKCNVSRLSPHLHWGEISPNLVWHAVKDRLSSSLVGDDDCDHFLSELGWREFSVSLLYTFPELPRKNLQPRFDNFSWKTNEVLLKAWKSGQTGYPIVDAGMRELRKTGYMHNRLRMIVGSFLVKNLRLHWHHGESWFWDCLVDADLASNSSGWQWIAGCGADAAPYFRIFNPIKQGEKFDPSGSYIRRYVPEISRLPNTYLCSPWLAPEKVLKESDVNLGVNYPKPVVDVKVSRDEALAAFSALREQK